MQYKPHSLFILLLLPFSLMGQSIKYEFALDLNDPEKEREFLFYSNSKNENTEFFKFCFIWKSDTACFENIDLWESRPDLYKKGNAFIDEWIGIFEENGKTYFWLTGKKNACCAVKTTILEWDGKKVEKIFEENFNVFDVTTVDGNNYLVGTEFYPEMYGDMEGEYYFKTFQPIEFRKLSNNLKPEKWLSEAHHFFYPQRIEKDIALDDACIVHNNLNGSNFLISKKMETSLNERDYGVISLMKLSSNYFEEYDLTQLRIIRNEIFAYYGYDFKSKDLKTYFLQQEWYKPTAITSETIYYQLSEIESYNVFLIKELEKAKQR